MGLGYLIFKGIMFHKSEQNRVLLLPNVDLWCTVTKAGEQQWSLMRGTLDVSCVYEGMSLDSKSPQNRICSGFCCEISRNMEQ